MRTQNQPNRPGALDGLRRAGDEVTRKLQAIRHRVERDGAKLGPHFATDAAGALFCYGKRVGAIVHRRYPRGDGVINLYVIDLTADNLPLLADCLNGKTFNSPAAALAKLNSPERIQ